MIDRYSVILTIWRAPWPFMHSALPVAGFVTLEAATKAEAIEPLSRTPCAVAHGVVEIWPLNETP